ncbi:MAG: type II toxin-antitoxin system HicB family antitoxin [Spirochaetales bacterium]|nr:type II toxin-antitoxin system HicB family antitoxin [Spirochaetales bacterium]
MKRWLFPACFRHVEGGSWSVDFPDLPGCVTAGDTLEEALSMAREALSLHLYGMLEDGDAIPESSDPTRVDPGERAFVAPVEGLPDLARDEIRNRAVKKTLTIPAWLNEAAEARRVNFSQVLKEALIERVGG